jgi:hypothetical protein
LMRQNRILSGQLFHLYLIGYGAFRFSHEFLRATPPHGGWPEWLSLRRAGLRCTWHVAIPSATTRDCIDCERAICRYCRSPWHHEALLLAFDYLPLRHSRQRGRRLARNNSAKTCSACLGRGGMREGQLLALGRSAHVSSARARQ